jgi:ADP-ribose pyrophosphatase YjhB (NUDIX family)
VAAAIVDDHDRILAIRRRDNGHWEPPGGVLELDETIEDGLAREIFEETGLTVTADRLTGVYKNLTRGIVALMFRCSIVSGTAARSDEAAEIAWLSADEIVERMDEAYAVRMLDALHSGPPAIRAHDGVALAASRNGTH